MYREPYIKHGEDKNVAQYHGIITAMDIVVGKVRKLLREFNLSSNTLLWFTSDNGPSRHSPGNTGGLRGWKGDLYEGGIRVPGIIEWPDVIKDNHKSNYPVVTTDLLPTVCDIMGVDPPSDRPIDGDSILPLLRGETSTRNRSIAWLYHLDAGDFHNTSYNASLIRQDFKLYVQYVNDKIMNTALYDLLVDRTESTDVKSQHQNLVQSMTQELEQWRESVIWSATQEVGCVGYSFYNFDKHCHTENMRC